jgi:periplasmic protein CpxP/Spy
MNKRTRVTVIGLVIVFLALSGAYAQGQEKYHQGEQGKKEGLFKELNLTPEQHKKLEDNRKARYQEMQELRGALKAAHEKLQGKLNNPAVTRATVEPEVKEINSLQRKMLNNRIDGILAVKAILTPEQFAKFNEIMEKQVKPALEKRLKGGQDKPKGPLPEME